MIELQIIFCIFCMQALATHLKRKNQKLLQQQLSLPRIPQNVAQQVPQTSARPRRSKPTVKYTSETTMSPQEEHIQDQIRLVLQKQTTKTLIEQWKIPNMAYLTQPKKEKLLLPRVKDSPNVQRKGLNESKVFRCYSNLPKNRSTHNKISLQTILRDRSDFIENYFADIRAKAKK